MYNSKSAKKNKIGLYLFSSRKSREYDFNTLYELDTSSSISKYIGVIMMTIDGFTDDVCIFCDRIER